MGACCSRDLNFVGKGVVRDAREEGEHEGFYPEDDVIIGDFGARVRLDGASTFMSMCTQQGRKGINQDAMTVWEEFTGDKDTFFCGVFDGHGPYGHKVASHVRDNLPSRLSSAINMSQSNSFKYGEVDVTDEDDSDEANNDEDSRDTRDGRRIPLLSSWEAGLIKSFKDMDEELSLDASIDSFCSGCTAVTVVKQGNHLIIANLGDSRAILCTRGHRNQLIPVQLTVDMKPNIAGEFERIKNCNGRVFALDAEPEVFRIWMPDDDCPGLAMARSFGDFCLKDYGLISVPEVSYRRLTNKDEFIVLATDGVRNLKNGRTKKTLKLLLGSNLSTSTLTNLDMLGSKTFKVWDVLTNYEVINIVASTRKRSMAAKMLVKFAVRAWRNTYHGSKVDDIAAVCLFLKNRTLLARSYSQVSRVSANHTELAENYSEVSRASINYSEIAAVPQRSRFMTGEGGWKSIDAMTPEDPKEENSSLGGLNRVNSTVKPSRLGSALNRRKSQGL